MQDLNELRDSINSIKEEIVNGVKEVRNSKAL